MENIKKQILEDIQKVATDLNLDVVGFNLTKPADKKWGDYTANFAFLAAKKASRDVLDIAKEVEAKLNKLAPDYSVSAAKNGFINFLIKPQYLQKYLTTIVKEDQDFGKGQPTTGKKIQIEFISANPTGPLTLGNGRGGFMGDALANVLQFSGYHVQREYYVNNVGNQIKILGYSIAKELGIVGEELPEFYAGDYIKQIANVLKTSISKLTPRGDDLFYQEIGQLASEVLLKDIQRVIADKLKIKFDSYYLESSIFEAKKDKKLLAELKDKGLTYEKEGALWFQTSKFGDDKDRVLIRSDGEPTYFLSDIVHKKENAENFDSLLMLLGADHYGYQGRLQASLEAFDQKGKLQIIIFQLVRLIKDGQEVRMSKRTGNYYPLEDLVDQVGLDVARFFFLMFAPNTHMDFDLNLALKKTNDNPVYYVQYAHTRVASILKKATLSKTEPDFGLLTHPTELELLRQCYYFPELVEDISQNLQVQKLPYYCISLAESLHRFYQECPVITNDQPLTSARIELVKAVKIVLRNSLALMGVSAPEKM